MKNITSVFERIMRHVVKISLFETFEIGTMQSLI